MSKETWEAVEAAIAEHMSAENEGAHLTQFVVVAHAVSAKESFVSHYEFMGHTGPTHEILGLLDYGSIHYTMRARRFEE